MQERKTVQGGTHQFHAQLVGSILGVRAGWQGEATPPVRVEVLLLELGVQTAGELHLETDHEME